MTATTSPPLPRPSPSPAQSSRDPLGNFVEDLDAILHRWNERTGGQWNETILYSFVDEEPLDGYARQRRGPQVNIALTLTDTTRTDELTAAHYPDGTPIDSPPVGLCERRTVAEKR